MMVPEPEPFPDGSMQHHVSNSAVHRDQRLTLGRRPTSVSGGFIIVGTEIASKEDQTQRRHSTRLETVGDRRSSNGCWRTRNLRQLVTTCCFWRRRHKSYASGSRDYISRHGSIGSADLCGSENESTLSQREFMSTHTERDISTTTTAGESSDKQSEPPDECPVCDSQKITVEGIFWHCGFCGASGVYRKYRPRTSGVVHHGDTR